MSDNQPTPPTPTPAAPPAADTEESRFRAYLDRYVTEHESKPVPAGQGNQQPAQQTPDLAAAIEAALTKRERASQSKKEMEELKTSNTGLAKRVEDLERAIKRTARDPFSIFRGL